MTTYQGFHGGGFLLINGGKVIGHVSKDDIGYKRWLAEGNTPEPAETDQEKIDRLTNEARCERDRLLREADTMELSSYQKRYGITQAQVEAYKNELRDWTDNNTTLEQLENPVWPTRP